MTEHNPTPDVFGDRHDTPRNASGQSPPRARSRQPELFDHGQHAAETRAIAAAAATEKAPTRRDQVELHVASCGERGATRHEIAAALDLPIQSVCGPVLALLTAGRLRETEKRRLTPFGKPAAVIVSPLIAERRDA